MKAIKIQKSGEYEHVDLSREDILKSFPVYSRDLRPVMLLKQTPMVFERANVIIMNLGFLKLLMNKDAVLLFNTRHEYVSEEFLKVLTAKLEKRKEGRQSIECDVFETAFTVKIDKLAQEYGELEQDAEKSLEQLRHKVSEDHFEQLLIVKNRLSRLETHVKQLEDMINDVLEDEEELKELVISQRRTEANVEEVESIFEHHFEQVNDLWNKIDDLRDNIQDNENIITLKMANIRNTIIQFDLLISIFTAAFGIPAIVVGFYGMNIPHFLEKNEQAALWMAVGIAVSVLAVMGVSMWIMKRKKIL